MRKTNSNNYKAIFENEINNNTEIWSEDKREHISITEDEEWRQCYDKTNKARKYFPPYWFVSDKGNLISVESGKALLLIPDTKGGKGYKSYHFVIKKGKSMRMKNIMIHNLVALVFSERSIIWGKAKQLLEKDGIFAFGIEESKVNGHHTKGRDNNCPEDIELISTKAHKLIRKHPKDFESEVEFMQDFARIAEEEEPGKISVFFTGEQFDRKTGKFLGKDGFTGIVSPNKISIPFKDSMKLNMNSIEEQNKLLVETVTRILLKRFGLDFFTEPSFLSLNNGEDIYRCQKKSDKIRLSKVTNPVDLVGKNYIACYINSQGFAECDLSDLTPTDELNAVL